MQHLDFAKLPKKCGSCKFLTVMKLCYKLGLIATWVDRHFQVYKVLTDHPYCPHTCSIRSKGYKKPLVCRLVPFVPFHFVNGTAYWFSIGVSRTGQRKSKWSKCPDLFSVSSVDSKAEPNPSIERKVPFHFSLTWKNRKWGSVTGLSFTDSLFLGITILATYFRYIEISNMGLVTRYSYVCRWGVGENKWISGNINWTNPGKSEREFEGCTFRLMKTTCRISPNSPVASLQLF